MMTDSNSDDSDDGIYGNSNIFTFQDQTQNFRVKGPNISNFNVSKLPIGQAYNGRPRYAESLCDQRSSYRGRRDNSPMSVYSATSQQHQNFQHSMYRGATGSQHSMYNPRFGSSMSVRSFDSNATFSAVDVAQALMNHTFNKHDMRVIKDAFDKCLKTGYRNRIEKKRRKRLRPRRRSGYDSGAQGSVSSLSSDDAASVRTARTARPDYSSSSCRSTKTDYTHIRRTMKDSDMYKDCTDSFRQNAFKSLMSTAPKYGTENINRHKQNSFNQRPHNNPAMNQKDRFRNGYLMPSQRFNQSIASSSIPENPPKKDTNDYCNSNKNKTKNPTRNNQHDNKQSASESEEIFSSNTMVTKTTSRTNDYLSKRRFNSDDDDESNRPQKKRNKLTSPQKTVGITKRPQKQTEKKTCDFVFVKPQLPLKKTMCINKTVKPKQPNENLKLNVDSSSQESKKCASESVPVLAKKQQVNAVDKLISKSNPPPEILISDPQPEEQLIARSTQPLDDTTMGPKQTQKKSLNNLSQEKDNIDQSAITQFSCTDMSMRPSFIKRKLFSQKADIAENKNTSSETLDENSPQSNMYSMIQKEKNRTRKLVASQSCMNRDLGDESNLLDLIHKIVPAEQMNLTSATNRTDIRNNKSKPDNSSANKWEVTSVITYCNKDEGSDTYTDEEIFKTNETVVKPKTSTTKSVETLKENIPKQKANMLRSSLIEKPKVNATEEHSSSKKNQENVTGVQKPKPPKNYVKSFWDSDEESDTGNKSSAEKTIIDMIPVAKMLEGNTANSAPSKNARVVQLQKIETTTKLASSNTKQKKVPEKTGSKPPQTKRDSNSKGTASNNKSIAKPIAVASEQNNNINTQAKQKVTKNLTSKDNAPKLTNKRATNNQHNDKEKNTYETVINKTLRIRKCRTPKINRCCDVPSNVSTKDVIQPLTRSLRTRDIDLSTLDASSGIDAPPKDVPKRKGLPRKNKLITEIENKENVSNLSDLSFTLTMDKTIATRRTKSKINGGLSETRKRPSDISFSLANDTKSLNRTGVTTRLSARSRTDSNVDDEVTKQKRMPIKPTNR